MTHVFERFGDDDVRALIDEFPLAWVSAADGRAEHASLLPLVGEYDSAGRLIQLVGHLAKHNPLFAALVASPRALILFRGPESYVSPAHAQVRNWAPTWNYAQLRIEAEVKFEPDRTGEALSILIEAMEGRREDPWDVTALGERYQGMLRAIIGFRARVLDLRGKFKLGQDEQPEVLRSIVSTHPDHALARWMQRFNIGRI